MTVDGPGGPTVTARVLMTGRLEGHREEVTEAEVGVMQTRPRTVAQPQLKEETDPALEPQKRTVLLQLNFSPAFHPESYPEL